ncbi:YugN family protein [Aneurinibacillus terranovensis]|uniref:YugN family protein n=1 Tax=Aneurinibacillus terranovensis TaxID=278991 RepID=UPI000414A0B0|nr:YugN family protein [Aneurinibacillus terranovensis]
MKIIETNLIGKEFSFDLVDTLLHDIGFNRGGMFDYDWAAYDYTLAGSKIGEYVYLRIFTTATSGVIERSHCTVKIEDVCITGARYHEGLDFRKKIETPLVNEAKAILNKVAEGLDVPLELNVRDADETDFENRSGLRPAF